MATIALNRMFPANDVYERAKLRPVRLAWLTGSGAAVPGDILLLSANRVVVNNASATNNVAIFEGPAMPVDAPTDTLVEATLILPGHLYEISANAANFTGLNVLGLTRDTIDNAIGAILQDSAPARNNINVIGFASTQDRYVVDSYTTKTGTTVAGSVMQPGAGKGIPGDTQPRMIIMFENAAIPLIN